MKRTRRWVRNALIRGLGHIRGWLPRKPGKRIIAFHEIKDASKFREGITGLAENYEIVTLTDLFSLPVGQKTQIAITFDDGYASWHGEALPILTELDIPAVFFVCSGFVGLQGWEADLFRTRCLRRQQKLRALTQAQLLELAHHPLYEIGSHTTHHIDLGREWDADVLTAEIVGDRQRLEDWTGQPVRWFAYPFGDPWHISPSAIGFIRQAGFLAAFTLIPGFWLPQMDRFRVSRDSLDVNDPYWVWLAWLAGAYDAFYSVKAKWLQHAFYRK